MTMQHTPPTLSLPAGVEWRHDPFYGHHWLFVEHVVVAQVTPAELVGDWIVYINRQWPIERRNPRGRTPSLGFGKKMAERWLAANFPRVRDEVDQRPKPHTLGCVMGERTGPPPVPFDETNFHVPKRKTRRRR